MLAVKLNFFKVPPACSRIAGEFCLKRDLHVDPFPTSFLLEILITHCQNIKIRVKLKVRVLYALDQ